MKGVSSNMTKKKRDSDSMGVQIDIENLIFETTPDSVIVKPKVPFMHWFDKKVKTGVIRLHQEDALRVFFKKQGLKDFEDQDTYNRVLELF